MNDQRHDTPPVVDLGPSTAGRTEPASASDDGVYLFPTSFGQERFWRLDRMQPGNPTWSVPVRFRLQGPLDVAFVERAFNEIVRRHEILRTTFTPVEGTPSQVIKSEFELRIPVTDLRHLPKAERDSEVDRLSFAEARRGFDLAVGPLIRVGLLRTEDQEYVLLVTPHHSVIDYISVGLISNELGALYEAYSRGADPSLPQLPIQYVDFAVWQREQAESSAVQSELAYWKEQLKDLPLLDFPTDHPRPAFPTYDATITSILLPVQLTDAVREIANREGATFFNTMLAALSVLLYQRTNQTDFGVATQVSGRDKVELEPLVGMFVNNIVLRMNLSGDPSLPELIRRVQDTGMQALAHQNVRFEQLLQELRPADYPSHHTLFRINFICQRDPVKPLEFSGNRLTVIPSKCQGALYDLNVFLVLRNEGWRLACEYNTGLYDAATIVGLLNDYRAVLENIVKNPNRKVSEFPGSQGPARGSEHNSAAGAPSASSNGTSASANPRAQSLGAAAAVAAPPSSASASGSQIAASRREAAPEVFALPASVAQERFWTLEELLPGNPALHMRACVRLKGSVSLPLLRKSLQALVERHETLRTTFERSDGKLLQLIAGSGQVELPVTSLEEIPVAGREEALKQALRAEASASFDLSHGPLMRARLFRLAPEEHVLILTTHHILVDGWSQNVIQRDLWSLYEAFEQGNEPQLPALPIQYGDFAHWQREWLAADEAKRELEFWKRELTPASPLLRFPFEKPSHGPATSEPMETLLLPEELVRSLKAVCQSQSVTLFVVLLAGYAALLRRYTGEEDICIGSPVANRKLETEPLIGPFAGPVTLRLNLSGNPTFLELLGRVRDVTLDALSHTDLPFETLLENLEVRSVHGRNPLSQCYFFYQNAFLQPRNLPGLTVTPLPDFGLGTHFELQLGMLERREGIRAQLEFNPHLFETAGARRILEDLQVSLDFLQADLGRRIDDLPVTVEPFPQQPPAAEPAPAEFESPRGETELRLAAIWQDLLHVGPISRNANYFDLGGTSLMSIRMLSRVREVLGAEVPLRVFFADPTIAQVAGYLESGQGASRAIQQIEKRGRTGALPLSFAQEQMWFLHQLAPDSPSYNIVDVVPFHGPVEPIKRAVNELIRRHGALRSAFCDSEGRPVQVVLESAELTLRELDLTGLPQPERKTEWVRIAREEARKPFDLTKAPLLRGTLVRLSEQESRLVLVLHHIISDEWSMDIVQREVRQMYQAFLQGQPSPLAALPIQYADFVCWHRERLQGEFLENQVAYWKEALAGATPILELPADKPRPASQSYRGATQCFTLPKALHERLRTLGREERATMFMTLAAAFLALLYRHTGQEDILMGTPISGRSRSETEGLIGCFINTIVLRAQFAQGLSFRGLLQQVRQRAVAAYSHQDLPFDQLVSALAPKRDLSHSPLVQVMFLFLDSQGSSAVSDPATISLLHTGTSKFDLSLAMSEGGDGLQGVIEYCADLFEPDTIRRFSEHFQTLLEAVARDPDQSLSTVSILPEIERHELLVDWNSTQAAFESEGRCLHEILAGRARLCADAVAAQFEDQSLTYGELDRRSNQLARYLQRAGVGPDVPVGLLVERSLDMLVGLLGILKAGGAYVPLDPVFPKGRLAYMVQDSGMQVLVTHRRLDELVSGQVPVIVQLDSECARIAEQADDAVPSSGVRPENLAYVLYTSGSSGTPKGVAIPHAAVVNFLASMQREPGFAATDTMLAVTTISFDIAGLELYLPLVVGGKVVIASREDAYDPVRLAARIQETNCSVMQATPATWKMLIESGWRGAPGLKALCGGESLPRELAGELLPRCAEVWNLYGPTETTIWSTIHRVTRADETVPIGRPIGNTQVYVLDAGGNLVPVGSTGELYIGGRGLARGYLNRAEQTRERFVPSPFVAGERLYRTGDLARWRAGGVLEWLGRGDFQVKVRGFRIELGEIESVLAAHPDVRQCVVAAKKNGTGEAALVAYYQPEEGKSPGAADLRMHLSKLLPEYMIPSAFVAMESLPLTPNGKIDRKALPDVDQVVLEGPRGFVAPRDPLEQMLAQLWSKILEARRVGVHDNFFELGGHSLLAVRLMTEIERRLNVRLPLALLLQAPTIANLAQSLRDENWKPSWQSLVPVRAGGSKPPLFLMHAHGGNVLEYYPLAKRLDPDQPVYALQSRGLDGRSLQSRSIEEMAAAYLQEVRNFQPSGPYFLGGFCFGGLLALEAAQQLSAAGERVALLVLIQTTHPATAHFSPDMSWFRRCWYWTAKRFDLERQNLSYRGKGYILERARRAWDIARARAAIAADRHSHNGHAVRENPSMPYVLEFLRLENDKAALRYVPRAYSGDVLLLRASKQSPGFISKHCLGWDGLFPGSVEICQVPGHQQNMLLEPHVAELAEMLEQRLREAQR